jgi:hypothetical protein
MQRFGATAACTSTGVAPMCKLLPSLSPRPRLRLRPQRPHEGARRRFGLATASAACVDACKTPAALENSVQLVAWQKNVRQIGPFQSTRGWHGRDSVSCCAPRMLARPVSPLSDLLKHAQYFAQTCVIDRREGGISARGSSEGARASGCTLHASVEQLKAAAVLDDAGGFDDCSGAAPMLRMPFDAAWLNSVRVDPFDAARSRKASPSRSASPSRKASSDRGSSRHTLVSDLRASASPVEDLAKVTDELVFALRAQAAAAESPALRAAAASSAGQSAPAELFTLTRTSRDLASAPQLRNAGLQMREEGNCSSGCDDSEDPTLANPSIARPPRGSTVLAPDARQGLPQLSADTAHDLAGMSHPAPITAPAAAISEALAGVPDSCAALAFDIEAAPAVSLAAAVSAAVGPAVLNNAVLGQKRNTTTGYRARIASAAASALVVAGLLARASLGAAALDGTSSVAANPNAGQASADTSLPESIGFVATAGMMHASVATVSASLQPVGATESHQARKRPVDPASLPLARSWQH